MGDAVGLLVGEIVGRVVEVGEREGFVVMVGDKEGEIDGDFDGLPVGLFVGSVGDGTTGNFVGDLVGVSVT